MEINHLVIGVGNEFRGDDAIGLVVARQLRELVPHDVSVLEQSGEGTGLMDAWQGSDRVILVDAASTGGKPGEIYRIAIGADPIPAHLFNYSTHAFSVAEAVEMARLMDQLPPNMVIYGIEGKSFSFGVALSPEVEKAAQVVIQEILLEFEKHDPIPEGQCDLIQ
jgi:hydrogenase maturation protease